MLPHEKRWAQAIMEAFAPPGAAEGLSPTAGEVDYVGCLEAMMRGASPLGAAGMRAALYAVNAAPLLLDGQRESFVSKSLEERSALLDRALSSDDFALRELTLLLKIQTSAALFTAPSVRARSGYDRDRGAPYPTTLRTLHRKEASR